MHNYFFTSVVAGIMVCLAGCQSTTHTPNTLFNNPFSGPNIQAQQVNLTQSVQEALMRSDELAISQVQVDAIQNTVILKGYVKKIRQSDIAEQITRQVPGVQSVRNEIVVRP